MLAALEELTYSESTCDGLPELSLTFETGAVYQINLSAQWVWHNKEEAALPSELCTPIQALLASTDTEKTSAP